MLYALFFIFTFCSKLADQQKELQAKAIEEETKKRIEILVAQRVEEELERRRDEIEAEVGQLAKKNQISENLIVSVLGPSSC